MSSTSPGSFQLHCRAFVGRARPVPGKPRSTVLDVVFRGLELEGSESEIKCSMRYFKGSENVVISDELYDIVANVLSIFAFRA